MERLRVTWTGATVVGPGLSTFYGDEGSGGLDPDDFLAFFDAIKSLLPAGTTITVPDGGDLLSDTSGTLGGSWSTPGSGGVVVGTANDVFAGGVGARAIWRTSGVVAGRRVNGATFLAPLRAGAYQADGTINGTDLATLDGAASALASAAGAGFVVWSRPAPGRVGSMHAVISGSVPDKVSWLRSRRT